MRRRQVLALGASVGFSGCAGIATNRTRTTSTGAPETTRSGAPETTPTATERPPGQAETPSIGGSLNGRPYRLEGDFELIGRSETTWVHAFLDVRDKHDRDVSPREDPDVVALRRVAQMSGTRLIVSLMWDYIGLFGDKTQRNVPGAGSARERSLIRYATALLEAIEAPIDVVVLGNEPVWETRDEDLQGSDQPLVRFTRNLKEHILAHYTAGDPRLLVGSFNRLYGDHVWREFGDFYEELFELARTDEDVAGVDLHVHYQGMGQAEGMLAAAREEFPEGTITATEFSPVWRYDRHKDEPIAAFEDADWFVDLYDIAEDTTVTEYLEAAKDDRLSRREMGDFMEAMPWYNVNFVEDMHDLLAEYDVEVGTFGFLLEDDVHNVDWTEGWAPFPINCLFQPALIDTEDGAHPHYLDDFRERT